MRIIKAKLEDFKKSARIIIYLLLFYYLKHFGVAPRPQHLLTWEPQLKTHYLSNGGKTTSNQQPAFSLWLVNKSACSEIISLVSCVVLLFLSHAQVSDFTA